MLIATEDVTQKDEGADFARNKPQPLNGTGKNICPHMKVRKSKAVTPILATQFEDYRHIFPEGDFARLELER
jgi:hypothetical protein